MLADDPVVITYLVGLDSLNDQWAEYTCPDMDGGTPRATFSVNREDWEKCGRPTIIQVAVAQWERPESLKSVPPGDPRAYPDLFPKPIGKRPLLPDPDTDPF